ncbi:uncharacterized protein LOC110998621 [Pieris rapae]|uniref:uncharacterized protein LOC110998621 n=1 Tax=Pieris rapae TaxID=64459 RepID=UPI001E280E11|nr:uncharacterized protein LOC110998621 [Pieris rapae]
MGDSLFDIFGDVSKSTIKTIARQPISSIENRGKTVSNGPLKPMESNLPMKKGETNIKRSFMSNKGKALQSTPIRQMSTPGVKVETLIYTDNADVEEISSFMDIQFTAFSNRYDNFHTDMLDYLPLPELKIPTIVTPPNTPPPAMSKPTMDLNCSYQDDFYTDDTSIDSLPDLELNLPEIF